MTLNTKLNASGSGVGRFVKAVGRSMVSGESTFITQVFAQSNNAYLALAHDSPGQVIPLYLGEKQYRLNDGAFLALDGTAYYTMETQSIGKAPLWWPGRILRYDDPRSRDSFGQCLRFY